MMPQRRGASGSGHPVVRGGDQVLEAATPLSFDIRSQEITSDEGDDYAQAASEASNEHLDSQLARSR